MTCLKLPGSNDQLILPEFRTIFHDITLASSEIEFLNTLSTRSPVRGDIGAISSVAINYKIAKINEQTAKLQAVAAEKSEKAAEEMAQIQKDAITQAEKTAKDTERHMNTIKLLTVVLAISASITAGIAIYSLFNVR